MVKQAQIACRARTGVVVMLKITAAIATATILAGAFVAVPGLTSLEAHTPGPKSDRLDTKTVVAACSQRGWPYYEASCLRNMTTPRRNARPVRIVTTDRLALANAHE
jgi:hypothetical protein